jgi:hypothetical protein
MMGEFIPHAEHGGFLHPYPKVNVVGFAIAGATDTHRTAMKNIAVRNNLLFIFSSPPFLFGFGSSHSLGTYSLSGNLKEIFIPSRLSQGGRN